MLHDNRTDQEANRILIADSLPAEKSDRAICRRILFRVRELFAFPSAANNLILLASGSALLFLFAAISGLFGGIEEWERKNDLSGYPVAEFVILLMVLGIATAIFLSRRNQQMRGRSLEGMASGEDACLAGTRPAVRYGELETLFRKVESAKKEWQLSLDSIGDMVILSELDGTIRRCNRAFRDFLGLPYEEILQENIASLLSRFGIDMKCLDLKALNARLHISGKWFCVRSCTYADFEADDVTRVVIIMVDVPARKVAEEKVQFVWGHKGHSRPDGGRPPTDDLYPG